MKFGNKVMFGVSSVNAGQKSAVVNAEPQLIANSTSGKFCVTGPVSKALNVAPGERIMFLNNIAQVEAAIMSQELPEEVMAYVNENGLDLTDASVQAQLIDDLTQWFIAKGQPLYDKKGQPIMASERFTIKDKENHIATYGQDIVNANREVLIERVGNENATDEELMAAITVDDIEAPKYHEHSGAKTSSTSVATGIGVKLDFTDTAIWNAIKKDLGEDKAKKNRIFNVLIKEPFTFTFNNGCKDVEVKAYMLDFDKDVDPMVRVSK